MTEETKDRAPAASTRRQALAKLGLAAGVAYSAPTLLHLDRDAMASRISGGNGDPNGNPKLQKYRKVVKRLVRKSPPRRPVVRR